MTLQLVIEIANGVFEGDRDNCNVWSAFVAGASKYELPDAEVGGIANGTKICGALFSSTVVPTIEFVI